MLQAPFPWFGGKRRIASIVWNIFGDVYHYVEPFAGSLAVLLQRPLTHQKRLETVNDADMYIANFWRAVKADPERVAHHADWPINECDLYARHLWLVTAGLEQMQRGLESDPEWYDVRIAGWWVWGISAWIGRGWCSPGARTGETKTWRQIPRLSANSGVHRKRPSLGDGIGIHSQRVRGEGEDAPPAAAYLTALARRLRNVRVCCGDWSRIVTTGALAHSHSTGIFLDPPYSTDRTSNIYGVDSLTIAAEVAEWCLKNGDNPRYRIIPCGYEGEHDLPGWDTYVYAVATTYQTAASAQRRRTQQPRKECLWISPHCPKNYYQQLLLGDTIAEGEP